MKHLLFLCSQNRLRSPTAEQVFSGREGLEVASAGLNNDAIQTVTPELLEWADVIFVMEKAHLNRLRKRFKKYLGEQRVICLNIPDEYNYMDPDLIEILERKVFPYIGF